MCTVMDFDNFYLFFRFIYGTTKNLNDDTLIGEICYRVQHFDIEGQINSGLHNFTADWFSNDFYLFPDFSIFYNLFYIILICGGLAVSIPICLVIYVYLHWPLIIVYDVLFTCLQTFGFIKGVNRWNLFMNGICKMWRVISRVWHGYQVSGMENIPKEGPAIFVFYHGTISVDIYYFVKSINLDRGKLCRAVFHKQLTKLPGFHLMVKVAGGLIGTKENCLNALKNGSDIVIAPGGDMEPLHSDETNYKLVWKNRTGFAKIAIEAQVPLIPVFTENIQELFRTPKFLRSVFLFIDKYLHLPLVPAYGGFPVKLISHVGKPIYPEPHLTPEELAKKTHDSLQQLIYSKQCIPGSIYSAIRQRFE